MKNRKWGIQYPEELWILSGTYVQQAVQKNEK